MQNKDTEFNWIKENFEQYKRELELINRQNPYECELYSVIATVIRCCMKDESISLRDVSKIQKCDRLNTNNFRSEWGIPDFVVLDKAYSTDDVVEKNNVHDYKIYGAVEIKYMFYDLVKSKKDETFELNFKKEIEAHIRYFKKVIYTNGLVWQFYIFDESKPKRDSRNIEKDELIEEFKLGSVVNGKKGNRLIAWEENKEEVWKELVEYLHGIDWKMSGKWGEGI